MNKKMYVDVTEVCEDWGVSRAQGYKIIKQLNERMLAINPNLIVLSGFDCSYPRKASYLIFHHHFHLAIHLSYCCNLIMSVLVLEN